MLSLLQFAMAEIVNCVIGNMDNAAMRVQWLLWVSLPALDQFKSSLSLAIIDHLYHNRVNLFQYYNQVHQREIVALLIISIREMKVLCAEVGALFGEYLTNHCHLKMGSVILLLHPKKQKEFLKALHQDGVQLSTLHFSSRNDPPLHLHSLLSALSPHLNGLKLQTPIIMPQSCSCRHLQEIMLCQVTVEHQPNELRQMPYLKSLVFMLVNGLDEFM